MGTERSMGAMRYAVLPSAAWLLRHAGAAQDTPPEQTERLVRVVEPLLVGVYQVLWLYPAYVVSFVVNCMWYQDIASHVSTLYPTFHLPSSACSLRRRRSLCDGSFSGEAYNTTRKSRTLGFGPGRQKMVLERETTPTLLCRTCSPRCGLQSW